MICEICGKNIKTKSALHQHLIMQHNFTREDVVQYDVKYLNLVIPKCPICGKHVKLNLKSNWRLFNKTCGDSNCKRMLYKQEMHNYYEQHPEAREKHRKDRIKFLSDKKNFKKTAWGIRANNKFTFLEQWFVDNILVPYKLGEKFDIVNEYVIYPYFIDFCFLNNHVCVELDGRCHFKNGTKRIEHDLERDKKLSEKGWNVYHITYIDVEQYPQKTIDNFITFLNQQKIYQVKHFDSSIYQTYEIIKKEKEQLRKQHKEKQIYKSNALYTQKQQYFIDLEQNSGIDFSKFGWVNDAQIYLRNKFNISIKQLHRDIKKYYPEFFTNNKVFMRHGTLLKNI